MATAGKELEIELESGTTMNTQSCHSSTTVKPSGIDIATPSKGPIGPQSREGTAVNLHQTKKDVDQDLQQTQSEPVAAGQSVIREWTTTVDRGRVLDGSECLVHSNSEGSVSIYKPPVKTAFAEEGTGVEQYVVGAAREEDCTQSSRVIILVGATGVGKSTLINGIANYVLGVRWEDSFRYKLIDEGTVGQAHSQTRRVASYTFCRQSSSPLPFAVTVIDTPGFGDTEGIERDKEILAELKCFFSSAGISKINAIGFVTQATLARLTPTQTYIFDSILSIFGKNIASSILLMATFADNKRPPVLEALRKAEVPYRKYFKFNNSALYPAQDDDDTESHNSDDDGNSINKLFWDLCMKGFMGLFEELSHMEATSLQQTKAVLEEREKLALIAQGLQQWGLMVVAKIEELKEEEIILNHRYADIEANRQFEYTIHIAASQEEDNKGVNCTNCINCHFTCHHNCSCSTTEGKEEFKCAIMEEDNCKVCPGKCKLAHHSRSPTKYVRCVVKKMQSSEDFKKRYQLTAEEYSQEQLVTKLREEVATQYYEAFLLVHHAQQVMTRLNTLALKPKTFSGTECIDVLIQIEEDYKEPSYQKRVGRLQLIQSYAKQLSDITSDQEYREIAWQKAQHLAGEA